eukprot:XP_025001858.1 leukocyte immunoglobulin-like receptor subfamily B member 4 [Gallus gallus]
MDKYEMQDVADFYITTKREHAGTYRCQYQVQKPLKTSEKSDPLELVLAGTNVTIRCWNKDYGATFLLHKDGSSAPIKH